MDHVIPKCTAASTIIRSGTRRNFTVLSHTPLEDRNLKGLPLAVLVYLLGKPDDWQVRPTDIMARFELGRNSVYNILKDLVRTGYAERRMIHEGGRIARWELLIFDTPRCPNGAACEDPQIQDLESEDVEIGHGTKKEEALRIEKPLREPTLPSEAPPQQKHRRSKLPETWTPRAADLAFAAKEFPGVDVKAQTALFQDHWRGTGDVRDDWDATFRNWIRRAPNFAPRSDVLATAHANGNEHHPEPTTNRSRGWDRSRESYEQYQARTHVDA